MKIPEVLLILLILCKIVINNWKKDKLFKKGKLFSEFYSNWIQLLENRGKILSIDLFLG
jgi:hypothetical protein